MGRFAIKQILQLRLKNDTSRPEASFCRLSGVLSLINKDNAINNHRDEPGKEEIGSKKEK
jgi:hypothetical protein